jgi:hypothetical protein
MMAILTRQLRGFTTPCSMLLGPADIYDRYRNLPEADLRRRAFPELFQENQGR